jgi:hypothetical protein
VEGLWVLICASRKNFGRLAYRLPDGIFVAHGYGYTGADGGVVRGSMQLTMKQPQYSLANAGPQKEL